MSFLRFGIVAVSVGVVAILVSILSSHIFSKDEERLIFNTEWNDQGNLRKLQLHFFPKDNGVELHDLQTKKVFLRRYLDSGIEEKDLYIDNIVMILSRQLRIKEYGDPKTKDSVGHRKERTFAMVKPDAVPKLGEILDLIKGRGFTIKNMKMAHLTREQAATFYKEHTGRSFFESMLDYITSGPIVALELLRSDAVTQWRKNLGPTDSVVAKEEVPDSVRGLFGTDKQANAAHGSDSNESAERELSFFFGDPNLRLVSSVKPVAKLVDSTLCIIKPHAVKVGHTGSILSELNKFGSKISGLQMFRLTKHQAVEFMEVYEGVLPQYPKSLEELLSGPLVAVEIFGGQNQKIVEELREFIGPMDPVIAKQLKPGSIRALYGEDKVRNGVHCTDLPEEASREVEFFFRKIQPNL